MLYISCIKKYQTFSNGKQLSDHYFYYKRDKAYIFNIGNFSGSINYKDKYYDFGVNVTKINNEYIPNFKVFYKPDLIVMKGFGKKKLIELPPNPDKMLKINQAIFNSMYLDNKNNLISTKGFYNFAMNKYMIKSIKKKMEKNKCESIYKKIFGEDGQGRNFQFKVYMYEDNNYPIKNSNNESGMFKYLIIRRMW